VWDQGPQYSHKYRSTPLETVSNGQNWLRFMKRRWNAAILEPQSLTASEECSPRSRSVSMWVNCCERGRSFTAEEPVLKPRLKEWSFLRVLRVFSSLACFRFFFPTLVCLSSYSLMLDFFLFCANFHSLFLCLRVFSEFAFFRVNSRPTS